MEDNLFENFWRKGRKDYTLATKEEKTVLANVLCIHNYDVVKFEMTDRA